MKIKTVIVGCGNIATAYAEQISKCDQIDQVGFFDIDPARAREFAQKFAKRAFGTLEEVLADKSLPASKQRVITSTCAWWIVKLMTRSMLKVRDWIPIFRSCSMEMLPL